METGVLKFCTCKKRDKCSCYAPVLALSIKLSELCMYSLGLGYNIGVSHFGVSEETQKHLVSGAGYNLDTVSTLYILSEDGKSVVKHSKITSPALPPCIFDCIKMPE